MASEDEAAKKVGRKMWGCIRSYSKLVHAGHRPVKGPLLSGSVIVHELTQGKAKMLQR